MSADCSSAPTAKSSPGACGAMTSLEKLQRRSRMCRERLRPDSVMGCHETRTARSGALPVCSSRTAETTSRRRPRAPRLAIARRLARLGALVVWGQYASELTISPLARVPRAHQVGREIESLTKRTLPSANKALMPPGWKLVAGSELLPLSLCAGLP
jgi:hypothetical protein